MFVLLNTMLHHVTYTKLDPFSLATIIDYIIWVSCSFAHTWSPNDPCFDWSLGLLSEGGSETLQGMRISLRWPWVLSKQLWRMQVWRNTKSMRSSWWAAPPEFLRFKNSLRMRNQKREEGREGGLVDVKNSATMGWSWIFVFLSFSGSYTSRPPAQPQAVVFFFSYLEPVLGYPYRIESCSLTSLDSWQI